MNGVRSNTDHTERVIRAHGSMVLVLSKDIGFSIVTLYNEHTMYQIKIILITEEGICNKLCIRSCNNVVLKFNSLIMNLYLTIV